MIESGVLAAYIAASIAIIFAPGPAQALVMTRTLSDGRRAGLLTAVGLNVGTVFHTFAAALGVSAILATSALAFSAVKLVGAAYLIYLGIQALRANDSLPENAETECRTVLQTFFKAVLVGILNPKVALFFLAFLPQFIDPARGSVFAQFMLLGSILAVLDILYEAFLVTLIAAMSSRLLRSRKFTLWRQRVTGIVLIGLGIRLALTQRE